MRFNKIYPFLYPPAFPDYNIPPTIYSLLDAIVNFGQDEETKIKDLAKAGHEKVFDFTYPLSNKVNKEDFECMILNHFMMRRIGYETMTAFKLALNVKLNEIMPMYNKLFDSLSGWDLFKDGEIVIEEGNNNILSSSTSSSTSDRRYSDTPQNNLENVQDGKYITDYNYDRDNGTNESSSSGNDSRTITRTPSDKMKVYKEFIENRKSIYTLIFEELDSLFYGLV